MGLCCIFFDGQSTNGTALSTGQRDHDLANERLAMLVFVVLANAAKGREETEVASWISLQKGGLVPDDVSESAQLCSGGRCKGVCASPRSP